uniref:Uncharacterized protein n=1 Tax=Arion vulgaris TaxID=1028688 RepID=A0A0B6Z899_9EUPU
MKTNVLLVHLYHNFVVFNLIYIYDIKGKNLTFISNAHQREIELMQLTADGDQIDAAISIMGKNITSISNAHKRKI